MKLVLKINGEEKTVELKASECTVAEALKKLGIPRENVLARKNGNVVSDSEKIEKADKVEIIQVIYGG